MVKPKSTFGLTMAQPNVDFGLTMAQPKTSVGDGECEKLTFFSGEHGRQARGGLTATAGRRRVRGGVGRQATGGGLRRRTRTDGDGGRARWAGG
ncbi:unnamed protein product [Linum trigynum]|uniref:Uncharacterized protein n=1 Tax=Linum trigynum TaxID=586398 RepID=A0AAV2D0P3_9ROSI